MDTKTLCLGVLSRGEASGYEIKRHLEEYFRHFFQASYGSIYPALAHLTDDALVTCESRSQEKRPDKKVYRITAQGRLALVKDLFNPPGADKIRSEFLVTMLFFELLPLAHLNRVIDDYLTANRDFLASVEDCPVTDPGHEFVTGFGRAVHGAIVDYLEDNRHLVEGAALTAQARGLVESGGLPARAPQEVEDRHA